MYTSDIQIELLGKRYNRVSRRLFLPWKLMFARKVIAQYKETFATQRKCWHGSTAKTSLYGNGSSKNWQTATIIPKNFKVWQTRHTETAKLKTRNLGSTRTLTLSSDFRRCVDSQTCDAVRSWWIKQFWFTGQVTKQTQASNVSRVARLLWAAGLKIIGCPLSKLGWKLWQKLAKASLESINSHTLRQY